MANKKINFVITKKKNNYTVADFFCGCGGFFEGFYQAGYNVIFSLDNWGYAKKTHDINHPDCDCLLMDILKIKNEDIDKLIPDTDIIVGSPPCVSFSNSNKSGKADKSLGTNLIHHFLKIILYKKTKPNSKLKYWIMENVPNSLEYVKEEYTAEELGLDKNLPNLKIKIKNILTASDYGSPQGRKRAIVGDYIVPKKTHSNNDTNLEPYVYIQHICDMLGPPLNNKNNKTKDILFNFEIESNNLTDHYYDSIIPIELWSKAKQLKEDHGFMGKMQFPDNKNRLSRTIMATESYCSREAMIFESEDKGEYRAPTIREISSLMGFPINYQFEGKHSIKHKQIGNAVCVQLSYALAIEILKKDNIFIKEIKQRDTIKLDCEQKTSLFEKFIEKPKKINSKYSRHIPYLKINGIRIELDNTKSNLKDKINNKNIETLDIIWTCSLHKGSGKGALKFEIENDIIVPILDDSLIKEINIQLELFSDRLYDAKLFQIKNCRIEDDRDHLSPDEILQNIKNILDILFTDEINPTDYLKIDFIKNKNNQPYPINPKLLYGLYCINYIVKLVNS